MLTGSGTGGLVLINDWRRFAGTLVEGWQGIGEKPHFSQKTREIDWIRAKARSTGVVLV
jgi:hypothetical protein